MSEDLKISLVLDDPDLLVWECSGASDRLVVCFSGVGPNTGAVPGPEFVRAASGDGADTVLFVIDPKRTWLNGANLIERIVELVEQKALEIGAKRVCTIGHSMGGFSAMVMPGFTDIDVAVAFSPQTSVHPDVVSDEPRWMEYRAHIDKYRIREVSEHIVAATQYFAFFGTHQREAPQRDRFPVAENIEQLRMQKTHHNTAQRMKARGILDRVVALAFDGRLYKIRRLIRQNYDGVLIGGRV